jgi:hypothetical protein
MLLQEVLEKNGSHPQETELTSMIILEKMSNTTCN